MRVLIIDENVNASSVERHASSKRLVSCRETTNGFELNTGKTAYLPKRTDVSSKHTPRMMVMYFTF